MTTPRALTAGERSSLEKVAELRGRCGRYRRAIVEARNLLMRHEHSAPKPEFPVAVIAILSLALEDGS